MLFIPALSQVKKIYWKNLEPGMIVLGGISVSGGLPLELSNYPAVTVSLLNDLSRKYHFKPEKEILAAIPKKNESSQKMSEGFSELPSRLKTFQKFREIYFKELQLLTANEKIKSTSQRIMNTLINPEVLIRDTYASLEKRIIGSSVPGIFEREDYVPSFGDVISGKAYRTIKTPDDSSHDLVIGLDFSSVSKVNDKLIYKSLENFSENFSPLYRRTKFTYHAFSEICREIHMPITGREIPKGKRIFTPFLKRILHLKRKDIPLHAVIITDGLPDDLNETILTGYKLKKLKIDFTQIFFSSQQNSDPQKIKSISEVAGGSLYGITEYSLIGIYLSEILDRYLGLRTLSGKSLSEVSFDDFSGKNEARIISNNPEEAKKKTVKSFTFKKI